MSVEIGIKLADGMGVPIYGTEYSAGLDLCVNTDSPVILEPHQCFMFDTGMAFNFTGTGLVGLVIPRSSMGKKGLILGNTVGVIDEDYRGAIKLPIWNRTDKPLTVSPKERVAQLLFVPYIRPKLNVVDEFKDTTKRGEGGFGSTGTV